MAKIIKQRTHTEVFRYFHTFRSKSKPYGWAGALFECDKEGVFRYPPHAEEFEKRKADPDQVYDGIEEHSRWRHDPAVLRCDCGEHLDLRSFTNTCSCGADYNMSGQLLAPRHQWGEETGESATDILNYDYEGNF